jgi:hypothetical protein
MKTRKNLVSLDDSMFDVIENSKMAMVFGGNSTGATATCTYSKSKKTMTCNGNDGDDSFQGE